MKATTKTKTAAIASSLFVLTGAALAHAATNREVAATTTTADLEAQVVQLGNLPGFWTADCPIGAASAAAWTAGDRAEASALRTEGFVTGLREPLRSKSGATGASLGLRFRSAAGATADLDRHERLAGRAGYATNFAVRGSLAARAYTVRTAGLTTVRVAYTRGDVEYAVQVQAPARADVGRLQRILAAAAARVAGHSSH